MAAFLWLCVSVEAYKLAQDSPSPKPWPRQRMGHRRQILDTKVLAAKTESCNLSHRQEHK